MYLGDATVAVMPQAGFSPEQEDEPDFGHYLSAIWRRKLVVVATIVVLALAVYAVDKTRTKVYSSTAQVAFLPQVSAASSAQSSTGVAPVLSATQINTDAQLISSPQVKAEVTKTLHAPAPPVTVSLVNSNAVIGTSSEVASVNVTSRNSTFASRAANAYVDSYLKVAQQNYLSSQKASEATVQTNINSLQAQIQDVTTQLAKASSSSTATISSLTAELTGLYQQQGTLQQTLTYMELATATSSPGQVAARATPSATPSSPKPLRDVGLAAALGLFLGIGLALIRDRLDNRLRSKDDMEAASGGLPTIGLIPPVSNWRDRGAAYLVAARQPGSPAAETYRGLRTSLQFMGLERPIKVLQLTSPAAFDGKTTTCSNLAWMIAEGGQRVILVDCDLRRPRVHAFFGLAGDQGLTSLLLRHAEPEDVLVTVPTQPSLRVLPAGPVPPNPSELLSGARLGEIIELLSSMADLILLDSPPVLAVSDAVALAGRVDGVLLVASSGKTTRREVSRAVEILNRVEAPLIGSVLNRAPEIETYSYYRYGYSGTANGTTPAQANGSRRHASGRGATPTASTVRGTTRLDS
jgi:succinoglycan biosynthesis transport protein ExoP